MKVTSILMSCIAVVGLVNAKSNDSNSSSSKNAAVAIGGANNAISAGVLGAAIAGAAAFLM
ncbi:hypothetical protein NCAS_0C00650 [Naumovozyma castellii]|uniref:Uncharacterized protein n=1 Tax=Naumovozyma castellii TaxID=27288 RepID=G0VC48_NAUCA|nr:hypothetical protein NCAS_0C00650 [Naumovozyma castellii CBS 4309]CCC69055.1 hypothetical protein NCAS_0C00650 [Naumovozyma castellii CBS 4309]